MTERIRIRFDAEKLSVVTSAARTLGCTPTQFITEAAIKAAYEVLND